MGEVPSKKSRQVPEAVVSSDSPMPVEMCIRNCTVTGAVPVNASRQEEEAPVFIVIIVWWGCLATRTL